MLSYLFPLLFKFSNIFLHLLGIDLHELSILILQNLLFVYSSFVAILCILGMSIDSHLERCLLVQTAELYSPGKCVNWNLSFCMGNSYTSYGKVTCPAVQELYRSSLVCPLIPILKGVFWSKRQSCTVLGSMLTEI